MIWPPPGHGCARSATLGEETHLERTETGVRMRAGEREAEVDLLLAALGRRPNTDGLGLQEAGFPLNERGTPRFDPATMQIGDLPVFIAGDANADRPLMHEAADEGAMAGYNAVHATDSLLRVYADAHDGRLLGASILAAGGEHLAHLLAWAIQRGETAPSLLQLPFYHPVIEELLQTALQDIVAQQPASGPYPLGLALEKLEARP